MIKKHSLILHLGPCRTSTTYLFNLLLYNNQLGNSTQMNIPRSQIELTQWIAQQKLSTNPLQNDLAGNIYMLMNNIKEDPSVNLLYDHTTTGHPLGVQTPQHNIDEVIQLWLNRLKLRHTITDLPYRLYNVTHNNQTQIDWLAEQLQSPHKLNLDTYTWGDRKDYLNYDSPIIAFAPTLCHGGMFQNLQYSVTETTTTGDILNSIPHRQYKLRLFIDALSRNFDSVTVLVGMRDPTERIHSWLNHLQKVTAAPMAESISDHSFTTPNPQTMRRWINQQLHIYSDMPTLQTLTEHETPHNVTVQTYHNDQIDPQKIFPHITDQLDLDQPTLSSGDSDESYTLNSTLLAANYDAYHKFLAEVPPL